MSHHSEVKTLTITSFIILGILYLLMVAVGKLFFLQFTDLSLVSSKLLYLGYMFIVGPIVIRRAGVLNFLESFLVMGVWTFLALTGDVIITANVAGLVVYTTWVFWLGYIVAALGMFFFHKKLHIHTRRELKKGHH